MQRSASTVTVGYETPILEMQSAALVNSPSHFSLIHLRFGRESEIKE